MKGLWGLVILGIVVFGLILYVSETMILSFNVAKPHKKYKHRKIKKSKISSEFKYIYNYIKQKYASELEIDRKKLIKSIIICIILFTIAFVLYLIFKDLVHTYRTQHGLISNHRTGHRRSPLALLFFPAVIYFILKYKKYNKNYVYNFKDKIVKNFIGYINNNLTYHQSGGTHLLDYYLDANFTDTDFNTFITDDYIEGYNNNNTKIELCNISLENTNERREFLNLSYEGIFSVSKLNIRLPYELIIKKNSYSLSKQNIRVKLDSSEFEKYFDVYCDYNIMAVQVLTHDIMEELINFYNTYKINFELVLKNNNIYIRFDTGTMFEPNILRQSTDMNILWIYYNILTFVINFTIKINKELKDLDI